ncbi:unnamed protein product [Thelazia callipaeda]|uniref:Ovule protein n=1 Tax=Thelazia callipaeda TaxID=103827 RepID=A0A0N5DB00_THECL|nr:unnamed protein product [Thelazia callipaeda]
MEVKRYDQLASNDTTTSVKTSTNDSNHQNEILTQSDLSKNNTVQQSEESSQIQTTEQEEEEISIMTNMGVDLKAQTNPQTTDDRTASNSQDLTYQKDQIHQDLTYPNVYGYQSTLEHTTNIGGEDSSYQFGIDSADSQENEKKSYEQPIETDKQYAYDYNQPQACSYQKIPTDDTNSQYQPYGDYRAQDRTVVAYQDFTSMNYPSIYQGYDHPFTADQYYENEPSKMQYVGEQSATLSNYSTLQYDQSQARGSDQTTNYDSERGTDYGIQQYQLNTVQTSDEDYRSIAVPQYIAPLSDTDPFSWEAQEENMEKITSPAPMSQMSAEVTPTSSTVISQPSQLPSEQPDATYSTADVKKKHISLTI